MPTANLGRSRMRPGDDSQDGAGEVRVTDKRRFTSSGDMRDGEPEGHAPAPTPPPPAVPPKAREAVLMDGEPQPLEPSIQDLGIQAIFFVFYQSAMIALGQGTPEGPARVDLAEARQAIHFLKILEEKTRGNLSVEETAALRELVDDAQLAFVQVARQVQQGGGRA
jgi:hypothetical protein